MYPRRVRIFGLLVFLVLIHLFYSNQSIEALEYVSIDETEVKNNIDYKEYIHEISGLNIELINMASVANKSGDIKLAKEITENANSITIALNFLKSSEVSIDNNEKSITNLSSRLKDYNTLKEKYTSLVKYYKEEMAKRKILLNNVNAKLVNQDEELIEGKPLDFFNFSEEIPSKTFTFTPKLGGAYTLTLGNYGGQSFVKNDDKVFVYSDPELKNSVGSDLSQGKLIDLKIYLTANHKYYIVVESSEYYEDYPYNRIIIEKSLISPTIYKLGKPVDVDMSANNYRLFKLDVIESGYYEIWTRYYDGLESSGKSDTQLSIYSDEKMTNLIAFNDDKPTDGEDVTFSQIKINLNAGSTYYIKLNGYNNSSVKARFIVDNIEPYIVKLSKYIPSQLNINFKENALFRYFPESNFEGTIVVKNEMNDINNAMIAVTSRNSRGKEYSNGFGISWKKVYFQKGYEYSITVSSLQGQKSEGLIMIDDEPLEYSYDAKNRLTHTNADRFEYDKNGNMLQKR